MSIDVDHVPRLPKIQTENAGLSGRKSPLMERIKSPIKRMTRDIRDMVSPTRVTTTKSVADESLQLNEVELPMRKLIPTESVDTVNSEMIKKKSDYSLQTEIIKALRYNPEISHYTERGSFDAVTRVVDILLQTSDKSTKERYEELLDIREQLDVAIKLVSENRFEEFNAIIYAVEPVERQLTQLQRFVQELIQSSDTIKKELEQKQGNLVPILQSDEFTAEYYNHVTQGLQIFEKIQRHAEEVDFLETQRNFLAAADQLRVMQQELRDDKI